MKKTLVVFSLILVYACPGFAQPGQKAPGSPLPSWGRSTKEVRLLQAAVQGQKGKHRRGASAS
jgi:hypothetical protein